MNDFNPFQIMVDRLNDNLKAARTQEQMTLGRLIEMLEGLEGDREVVGFGEIDSYRGYYSDLAFEPNDSPRTVADLLKECRSALNTYFTGYKGGDYYMGENTPLWVSSYGKVSGMKLMGINVDADPIQPITEQEALV